MISARRRDMLTWKAPFWEVGAMFQKLLLPVDLADRHHAALDIAARMAAQSPGIDLANPAVNWGSLSFKIGVLSQCPVLIAK
jgi:hypothetical protein